ncbi:DUF6476 family protein [Rubellimicrobium arenae]|uniref:DUF6476 family protein n=1 Tax=Rubellimicrobium arenae TaxID=2817372 RepID=UPI001B3133D8|nr:DUF6476 family protein [Rubellimicrobium arenae]
MDTAPEAPLPPGLRALQRLVVTLIVVMIVGFLVLIGALVMRLNADGPPLPDSLQLPEGARATAFTQGGDWLAIVTGDDRILIYDRLTGRLRQTLRIDAR